MGLFLVLVPVRRKCSRSTEAAETRLQGTDDGNYSQSADLRCELLERMWGGMERQRQADDHEHPRTFQSDKKSRQICTRVFHRADTNIPTSPPPL